MKLATNRPQTFESFGPTGETKTVGVSDSAMQHILELLSSFYENAAVAVARELISNGLDAATEAGVTPVIKIETPGALTKRTTVTFTDNGIGMTPEILRDTFAAYGESTKRHTDDLIGGFGLGCKTPYMLSDTFTVTTTRDGVSTYATLIKSNDAGLPEATFLTLDPLPESGTTISIPVKHTDLDSLTAAIRKVGYWMAPGTVVLDGDPVLSYLNDPTIALVCDSGVAGRHIRGRVVMGGIAFAAEGLGVPNGVTVFCEVGELTPTPQRDQLRDNKPNRERIAELVGRFRTEGRDLITAQVDAGTLLEAAEFFHGSNDHQFVLGRTLGIKSIWNGQDVPFQIDMGGIIDTGARLYSSDTGSRIREITVPEDPDGRSLFPLAFPSLPTVVLFEDVEPGYKPRRRVALCKKLTGGGSSVQVYAPAGFVWNKSWLTVGGPDSNVQVITQADIDAVELAKPTASTRTAVTYKLTTYNSNGTSVASYRNADEVAGIECYVESNARLFEVAVDLGMIPLPATTIELSGSRTVGALQKRGAITKTMPTVHEVAVRLREVRDTIDCSAFSASAGLARFAKYLPADHFIARRFQRNDLYRYRNEVFYSAFSQAVTEDVYERYPLLEDLSHGVSREAVVHYIGLVDASSPLPKTNNKPLEAKP